MVISWYGHSCFKIQTSGSNLTEGQIIIITDPFSKETGLTPPRGQADIVTVSHQHYDHDNVESVAGEPFVVDMPGEYETKGIAIKSIISFHDEEEGKKRGVNIIHLIKTEGMTLCHLGDLGQAKLTADQLENLNSVDVLFIPVGGKYTINASQAADIINQIEPKIVIPMHFKTKGLKIDIAGVEDFLKEVGDAKKVEKLTLKKKDLPAEDQMEVVVFKN